MQSISASQGFCCVVLLLVPGYKRLHPVGLEAPSLLAQAYITMEFEDFLAVYFVS